MNRSKKKIESDLNRAYAQLKQLNESAMFSSKEVLILAPQYNKCINKYQKELDMHKAFSGYPIC